MSTDPFILTSREYGLSVSFTVAIRRHEYPTVEGPIADVIHIPVYAYEHRATRLTPSIRRGRLVLLDAHYEPAEVLDPRALPTPPAPCRADHRLLHLRRP